MKSWKLAVTTLAAASTFSACDPASGGEDAAVETQAQGLASSYNTKEAIIAHLVGKTLTMEGANIPTHPNGVNEDFNAGNSTQCYHKVVVTPKDANAWHVVATQGTLSSVPVGSVGECDRATPKAGSPIEFTSSAVAIENVASDGSCFDVTFTYPTTTLEGRATLDSAGTLLTLELFVAGKAVGHRCANGAVGQPNTVSLVTEGGNVPFTGDAQQKYVVAP